MRTLILCVALLVGVAWAHKHDEHDGHDVKKHHKHNDYEDDHHSYKPRKKSYKKKSYGRKRHYGAMVIRMVVTEGMEGTVTEARSTPFTRLSTLSTTTCIRP